VPLTSLIGSCRGGCQACLDQRADPIKVLGVSRDLVASEARIELRYIIKQRTVLCPDS
jgi:hypothetical protein